MNAQKTSTSTTNTEGAKNYKAIGEEGWKRADKVNADLLALTYGCFVAQVARDSDSIAAANKTLDRIGFNMGVRLIDDFLARNIQLLPAGGCGDFRDMAEVIGRVAFKQYLNVTPSIQYRNRGEFVLAWPLSEADGLGSELVELPELVARGGLHYQQIICGLIRGALEMINFQVECTIINDPLLATPSSSAATNQNVEILVKLVKIIDDSTPPLED